ncbi:putative O-methyltransferase, partial [Aureobasidium melanogenum]
MGEFDPQKRYQEQEETFFDDGREIELLHFVYSRPDIDDIRDSPAKVLAVIDEFARTKKYLMNVGEDKGRIVTDLIAEVKPKTMVELGGYVGYSCILFGDAVRKAGGARYFSLERNPEFAAVIASLVDLAGLSDIVKVVVGSSDASIKRLHSKGALTHIDLMFLDHYKPAYTTDLKLCEELGLITPGSVLAADNVIKPGNPPYLEYVRSTVEEKRRAAESGNDANGVIGRFADRTAKQYHKREGEAKLDEKRVGNPLLIYDSKLIHSWEPTGVPPLLFGDKAAKSRSVAHSKHGFHQRTILVTGVGMTKGLVLARLFYEAGHDVIGADFEPFGSASLVCGRVSRSLKKFYRLRNPHNTANQRSGSPDPVPDPGPYIQSLLDIITRENVDLWTLHEKHTFIEYTKSMGLTVPETREVTSRAAVEEILRRNNNNKRKYILKTIGVDDAVRGDMTLLPTSSPEETARHLARLNISPESPWILQQFIRGKEYCTHALVVRGKVMAFVACPSADLLMHYEALPADSPLSQAMLKFTQRFAASAAAAGDTEFTGHLSFDFMVETGDRDGGSTDETASKRETPKDEPDSITLYPIECNPRAHTAVALFNGTLELVDKYLSVLEDTTSGKPPDGEDDDDDNARGTPRSEKNGIVHQADDNLDDHDHVVTPTRTDKYYWIGHDLVTLLILPTLSFLIALDQSLSLHDLFRAYLSFFRHLFTWRDGTYESWDPLPWWWLYHVYWPARFWTCLRTGTKWSRVNVSTTKVFQC